MFIRATSGGWAGVVLGRSVLVKDDLACGRLVKPFPVLNSSTELAYYIVWRPEHDGLEKVQAFKGWLLEMAAVIQGYR